jgi:hypothetical protein
MHRKPLSKAARDNRANQLNPTHPVYHRSRGASVAEGAFLAAHAKPALDNRANQLNSVSDDYRRSRGMPPHPRSSSNRSPAKSE